MGVHIVGVVTQGREEMFDTTLGLTFGRPVDPQAIVGAHVLRFERQDCAQVLHTTLLIAGRQ